MIRTAEAGEYHVIVKLFASRNKFTGTTVLTKIWTHYGDPSKEQERTCSVRLQHDKEQQDCNYRME